MAVERENGADASLFRPGDIVLTSFGTGVLISCPSKSNEETRCFQAKLWRTPGKSMVSSAVAFLQPESILKQLPVASGMSTICSGGKYKGEKVMVHCYDVSKNMFLVAPFVEDPNPNHEEPAEELELSEVTPDELEKASGAKFYPLINELMRRGDETAAVTTEFLNQKAVTDLVAKTTNYVESSAGKGLSSQEHVVQEISASVQSAIPDETQIKQVYTMLKDEELTVLLKRGKERLEELVAKDIPEATKVALERTGITVVDSDKTCSSFTSTIVKSRETALSALEELLVQNANMDFATAKSAIRGNLEENFGEMFDSMREAAQSDQTLTSIFDTVSKKTSEWQEASGRLMSTKSAGLFMEGANRLKDRAAAIFSADQLDWAGEIGTKFTKAFTEGDTAVAKLKSIEMGDAVRSRLVDAIEMRSGSHGGLDAIIAGALTTVKGGSEASNDQMQTMLTNLQGGASSATKNASETLLSVLSSRSQYRDIALLRIEKTLCDLEIHLGDEMSAEEIANLARGDGGTSALFEPIARRAAKEIEKQLDAAEANVSDPSILAALKHVRKIISGDLSVAGLLDEAVNALNDEEVVAAGETLMMHSENVLDAIEGISGNKMVGDALQIAENAGITKDTIMKQMELLDVNDVLDTAQGAVTDEEARQKLLSSATDTALDFILRILPAMEIPPFDGVKEGMIYHLSNLSMKGFKVKKENIVVEIAGMRATKASNFFGKESADQQVEASNSMGSASVGSNSVPGVTADTSLDSTGSAVLSFEEGIPSVSSTGMPVNPKELLIIDVHRISSVINDVVWSFEQTYLPYLKGNGLANVKLSGGSIRLQFELRKRRKAKVPGNEVEWEPVLCLHDRNCAIKDVNLVLQGEGRLTWIFNKLAGIFKGPLRDYVVKTIKDMLTQQSGSLLETLNTILSPYWEMILRTAKLDMIELVEADSSVITATVPDKDEGLVELVWKERLPLGMNLLLNDTSGRLKIVDFPRGSQARSVCMDRGINPIVFNGSTIVAVNGTRYEVKQQLFEALKDPIRPKAILFKLANAEDAERIKRFVAGSKDGAEKNSTAERKGQNDRVTDFAINAVNFTESGELGIEFSSSPDNFALVVNSLHKCSDGIVFAAEREGVCVGDLLSHINGQLVFGGSGAGKSKALSLLQAIGSDRPLVLSFVKPYLVKKLFEKASEILADSGGPEEFNLEERELSSGTKRVVVRGFNDMAGSAETGGVFIGDHLIFVNGTPVGAGCRLLGELTSPNLQEVYEMLHNKQNYPIGLTFAREKKELQANRWTTIGSPQFDVESAETICITSDNFEQLGCIIGSNRNETEIVVTDLFAVPGSIQQEMNSLKDENGRLNLSIESINGQFVPSYATSSIVMNALKRSWTTSSKMEVLLCDEERKKWTIKLS